MHVKVAGLDDLQRLSVFFLEAGSEAGQGALGFTGATDDAIHELASERTLEAKLTSPTLRIFVAAEDGGRILGFASVKKINSALAEARG